MTRESDTENGEWWGSLVERPTAKFMSITSLALTENTRGQMTKGRIGLASDDVHR